MARLDTDPGLSVQPGPGPGAVLGVQAARGAQGPLVQAGPGAQPGHRAAHVQIGQRAQLARPGHRQASGPLRGGAGRRRGR